MFGFWSSVALLFLCTSSSLQGAIPASDGNLSTLSPRNASQLVKRVDTPGASSSNAAPELRPMFLQTLALLEGPERVAVSPQQYVSALRTMVYIHLLPAPEGATMPGQTFDVYRSNSMYASRESKMPFGRVREYGLTTPWEKIQVPAPQGYTSQVRYLGKTSLTPAQLADTANSESGVKGIFAEALAENPLYKTGPDPSGYVNDEHSMMQRFVDRMRVADPKIMVVDGQFDTGLYADVKQVFTNGEAFNLARDQPYSQTLKGVSYLSLGEPGNGPVGALPRGVDLPIAEPIREIPPADLPPPGNDIVVYEDEGILPQSEIENFPRAASAEVGLNELPPGWTMDEDHWIYNVNEDQHAINSEGSTEFESANEGASRQPSTGTEGYVTADESPPRPVGGTSEIVPISDTDSVAGSAGSVTEDTAVGAARPANGAGGAAGDAVTKTVTAFSVRGVITVVSHIVTVSAVLGGAAVVILDIIHKNWVGVALGVIGTVALTGLAVLPFLDTALALSGPVGWIVAGIITLFFLILPGLFGNGPKYPSSANATQIIQFKMFDNKDHTGNEGCRKKTATNPNPNPNCTALYGPGTLSASFGWETFDSVIFLLQCNRGYPISIPDMAACFNTTVLTRNKPTPNGHYANIYCNNNARVEELLHPGVTKQAPDCQKPSFAINRTLVNVPLTGPPTYGGAITNFTANADQLYNRIIGPNNPKGDCVLFTDVAHGVKLPYLNLIYTGVPAGIQCGVGPTFDPNGDQVQLSVPVPVANPPTGLNSTTGINGTNALNATNTTHIASTDGSDMIGAPTIPQFPFFLANSSNALCFDNLGELCLFNGTYDASMSRWGFALADGTTITTPPKLNASLTLDGNWNKKGPTSQFPAPSNQTGLRYPIGTSVTDNINAFWKATNKGKKATFSVNMTREVTGVCLFELPQYLGSAACYPAPSAGMLPALVARDFQSLTLHGGANVEMFAQYYGDGSRQYTATNIPDLTAVSWGTHSSMSKNVSAMAVYYAAN